MRERPPLVVCSPVDELIESNLAVVTRLVHERLRSVPAHVDRSGLISAGYLALVVSAQTFDGDRGVAFSAFAAIRIRGALVDELRRSDWASRSVRARAREVERYRGQLALVRDQPASTAEVARAMGVSVGSLDTLQSDVTRACVLSLDVDQPSAAMLGLTDPSPGPEACALVREQVDVLRTAVAALSDRLRRVVTGYFFEECSMGALAAELGLSQPRVSQLCAEALGLLRCALEFEFESARSA